jgi:uncharacterized protein YacL
MAVVWAIRVAFILVIFGVGWAAIINPQQPLGDSTWVLLAFSLIVGVLVMIADYVAPRKKLSVFAGAFFGLLVGIVLAYALSFVTQPLVELLFDVNKDSALFSGGSRQISALTQYVNLIIGAITCYLAVSFVLQTKDDFRFIVPYVEFAKQTKGSRPVILDTSAVIDGRIVDIAKAGLLDAQLIIPRFVLAELQTIADSADRLKRNRGRRGLDVVARLQELKKIDVVVQEASHLDTKETNVDQLLMILAKEINARVMTTDFNLNKVAQVGGVDVININDLANAVKSDALPGETMRVHIQTPGKEPHQGVGYLDDGTMIVVEHASEFVDQEVEFVVTNARQTSAGKMIFGRLSDSTANSDSGKLEAVKPTDVPARPDTRRPGGNVGRSPRRGSEQRG